VLTELAPRSTSSKGKRDDPVVRIEGHRRKPADYTRASEPVGAKGVEGVNSEFKQGLKEKEETYCRQRMELLLVEIDEMAEKLAQSLDLSQLMRYRRLVREFLKEATARAYLLREEKGLSRRGASSLLVTVRTVDAETEELLKKFASRKTTPDDILAILDKIRGMLVDLLA